MSWPKQPKLHLNEHLSPSLAIQLRAHGINVTSTQETNLRTAYDDVQLAYAAKQQRAIVTFNLSTQKSTCAYRSAQYRGFDIAYSIVGKRKAVYNASKGQQFPI